MGGKVEKIAPAPAALPAVVKKDGSRVEFDPAVRRGAHLDRHLGQPEHVGTVEHHRLGGGRPLVEGEDRHGRRLSRPG